MLSMTGVASVEAASFVHPKLVPQMAGAAEIMQTIRRHKHVAYPVLVPNRRGYDDALKAGSSAVAVMCSASNTFAQRNVKQTMQQQVEGAVELAADAVGRGVPIRGYISCALGCPFEGAVPVEVVVALAKALADAGCDEVVLADTIGEYIIGKLGRGNASKAAVASLRRRPNDFTAATARAAAST
ncbi:hydroxymethylglutaryl- lyase [Chrysochromulina tobinii]|uniref:hydroxymethylglutaryl-CoA lyase n=1 Tax=Chrysochromulina tobinii TaxID=1460289 RepID=A0A0M0JRZ6_9EUKA|nr:hydroxymethylglutaryl- lyase [Chrysochromulina tobinii]|eukprot:KOO29067.1 hydroxymethylglutaryl- lyase [Chrysochromulina sp. CCMP291]